ncbi:RNA polymerase sigma factor [Maribacter sp. X9]|uniref:RNA polymerase sigma factor n=1 Tax=Maribacter sp. X9 TaxID=3402159 RepID=UPI003AF3A26E
MNEHDHEKRLSQGIIEGNELAFKDFFEKYNQTLMGYVMTLTQDHEQAKDIVQLSFVSLWKKRTNLQPDHFGPLLFTMAKNLFIDHYRNRLMQAKHYAELTHQALTDEPEDDEHLQEKIKKLKKTIEILPERCQQILRMTKLEGLTQQEVADYLGISVRSVEAQIRIAYNKIRESFNVNDTAIFFLLLGALKLCDKSPPN